VASVGKGEAKLNPPFAASTTESSGRHDPITAWRTCPWHVVPTPSKSENPCAWADTTIMEQM
jgi:hypothetical protein